MKNKNLFLSLLLLLLSLNLFAQKDKPGYTKWTEADYRSADTGKDTVWLSELEKKTLYYMNIARMNPQMFADLYLKDYMKSGHPRTSFVKSLEEDLALLKPMKALQPVKDLFNEAMKHADEMGKAGRKGHNSIQGKNLKQRYEKLEKLYISYGENIDYGNADALDIVFSLLIDEEVKNLAHRKNILNPLFNSSGISVKPHKKLEWICVMDFGQKK